MRYTNCSMFVRMGLLVCFVFCSIQPASARSYAARHFPNLGFLGIFFNNEFWGYQSAVDRDYTSGQPAYDYAVHIIKTGEDTGERYRMFHLGRWLHGACDGDHILQNTSPYGAANTWCMWTWAPDVDPGIYSGGAGTWWGSCGNVGDPEVVAGPDSWYMFVQVEIDPGMPLDYGGTAAVQADRLMLLTSSDCKTWSRWTTRGVITNIADPPRTHIHHPEVIYCPWDTSHPWWLYFGVHHNNVFQGTFRIRSATPYTFDWNAKEVAYLSELGNQIGYIPNVNGAPLFIRITFTWTSDRTVPTMQFSRDGIHWEFGTEGPVQLEGSTDNGHNKNCLFLGMSTLNGTGELPYYGLSPIGNRIYRVIFGASTFSSDPEVWYSEIGVGECYLEVYP